MNKLLIIIILAISSHSFSQNHLWSISYGTTASETPYKFATNAQGDIISTGYFTSDIDLDPSASTANFTNNGSRDLYIQKLNSNGDFVWGKTIGSTGQDEGRDVVIDNADNIFILGTFENTVDFNTGGSNGVITSNGSRDVFLLKLNNTGDFVWVKNIGGIENDDCFSLVIDNNDNLYISGVFYQTVDFGLGSSPQPITSIGSSDAFVLKLNNNGDYIWVKAYGSTSQDYAGQIMVNNLGEVYVAGGFANIVEFEYGVSQTYLTSTGGFFGLDSYLLKLDNLGNYVWVKHTCSSIGDVFVMDSKMDNDGNIYNIGSIEDVTDFDPSSNTENANTVSSTNQYFIQKLNSNGDLVWAKLNGAVDASKMTITNSNNLLLVGSFSGTVDFDLGVNNFDLTPQNSTNGAFFQTINSNGEFVNAYYLDGFNNQACYYGIKDIKYDNNGDILVYGQFSGTIDLNVDPNQNNTYTSLGSNDIFFLKQTNFDVGLDKNNQQINFDVYPNPTNDLLTIKTDIDTKVDVKIYNINGALVYSNSFKNKININLQEAPGVYIVELNSENSVKRMKLVKK